MKKVNCLGQRFGRLLVIEESPTIKGRAMWKCKCDCGNIKVVSRVCLVDGTKSCGCLLKDTLYKSRITHGRTRTVEYYAWVNMRTRCYNPQCADDIKNYLRKGIIVCERWLNSFENFYEDMGERPSNKHSIDRINNDGIYEPSNCRWATISQQAKNKGCNRWFEYENKRMILQEWANYFGISQASLVVSLKCKSFQDVYNYYFLKYNGVFPDGNKRVYQKVKDYNLAKCIIALKDGLPMPIEFKSIREAARETGVHHYIITASIRKTKKYKDFYFEYL